MGVEKALVTCNANNGASARVIEKCGGVRISGALTQDGVEWRHWIGTAPVTTSES
jgi:predicted acetyltransferase